MLAQDARLSGPLLKQKAEEIARESGIEFVATEGWLCCWKLRNNVVFKRNMVKSWMPMLLEPIILDKLFSNLYYENSMQMMSSMLM